MSVSDDRYQYNNINNYNRKKFAIENGVLLKYTGIDDCGLVLVPDGVVKIGVGAFQGCSTISSVVMPPSLIEIEDRSFYLCSNLEFVTLKEGVQSIGDLAFSDCARLKVIDIPSSLRKLGEHAFCDCEYLEEIRIPEGIDLIPKLAFNGCRRLKEVKFPNSLKKIEDSAFYGIVRFQSIEIPYNVEYIGSSAFGGCPNLKNVVIRNPATVVEQLAFINCYSDLHISKGGSSYPDKSPIQNATGLWVWSAILLIPTGLLAIVPMWKLSKYNRSSKSGETVQYYLSARKWCIGLSIYLVVLCLLSIVFR